MTEEVASRGRGGYSTRLTSLACSPRRPRSVQGWGWTREERSGFFDSQLFLSTFDWKKAEGVKKKGRQGARPAVGPRATSQSAAVVYDLSTLGGPVHGAPGNPAQRNMVAAMSIHQHTHNHMPPLSFQ